MNAPTKKIITPQAKVEIEIKDWITGAEAEYIDNVLLSGIDIKPEISSGSGKVTTGKFDTNVVTEQIHREIEKFIVSVDSLTEKILEAVGKLPEDDYAFIIAEISKRRKKKGLESVDEQQTT